MNTECAYTVRSTALPQRVQTAMNNKRLTDSYGRVAALTAKKRRKSVEN